jgi:hypothetical protein
LDDDSEPLSSDRLGDVKRGLKPLFGRTAVVAGAVAVDTSWRSSADTLPPLNSCTVDAAAAALVADEVEAAEAVADVATPENNDELELMLVAG